MKMITAILVILTSAAVNAEIWQKPPYKPDENHLPKETVIPREAQEESPEIKDGKHQEIKKPESSPDYEFTDGEIKEGEESVQ